MSLSQNMKLFLQDGLEPPSLGEHKVSMEPHVLRTLLAALCAPSASGFSRRGSAHGDESDRRLCLAFGGGGLAGDPGSGSSAWAAEVSLLGELPARLG